MRIILQLLLVTAVLIVPDVSSNAFAQQGKQQNGGKKKGGQQGRGQDKVNMKDGYAARLPPGFQQLSRDEIKQLDALCNRCLDWLANVKSVQEIPLVSIADFFGSMEPLKDKDGPSDADAAQANRFSESDIGYYVLSRLTAEQRNRLGALVVSQRSDIEKYEQFRGEVIAKLQSLDGDQQPDRGFDRAVAESAKAAGELTEILRT